MLGLAKTVVKRTMETIAPRWTAVRMAARARKHSHDVVRQHGLDRLNAKLLKAFGNRVQEGPFAGTIMPKAATLEHIGPLLLGVYESELDTAWTRILRGEYSQILDVGARFGYYAVGLARHYPQVSVVAFDIDPWAQQAIAAMAARSGVTNLTVHGFCTPDWLRDHLQSGALIISDCEGYEADLFEGACGRALESATVLVETHDDFVPRSTARVSAAFARSHRLTTFDTMTPRRMSSLDLSFLSESERQQAQHELRGDQAWLLCEPERRPSRRAVVASAVY